MRYVDFVHDLLMCLSMEAKLSIRPRLIISIFIDFVSSMCTSNNVTLIYNGSLLVRPLYFDYLISSDVTAPPMIMFHYIYSVLTDAHHIIHIHAKDFSIYMRLLKRMVTFFSVRPSKFIIGIVCKKETCHTDDKRERKTLN